MKTIKLDNRPLVFMGDVHGNFGNLRFGIRNKLEDVNLVACGDFGMGFHKLGYYSTEFRKLNKERK